jgi:uncharacterized protein YhhL (DUF1145 family)
MGLIEFILLCVVVGLVVWAVNTFLPLPQPIKTIILVAAILVLLFVLLRAMGIFGGADIAIPRVR